MLATSPVRTLPLIPPSGLPARRRGRPPGPSADPEARTRHLCAAALRFGRDRKVESVARDLGVTPRTVKRWTAKALRYDGPDAELVRALAAVPRRDRAGS